MNTRMKSLISNPLIMVIDMQNVYSKGQKWECSNFDRTVERIKFLLEQSKCDNVLFTRYVASNAPIGIWSDYNSENADINDDVWLNEIVEDLSEYTDVYKVLDKSVYSSWSVDEVKAAATTISCVVVTGVVAECCVLSTVMSLIDAGIYVIYLKDAIAGVDECTENAVISILEGLEPLHLSIMNVNDYLNLIG